LHDIVYPLTTGHVVPLQTGQSLEQVPVVSSQSQVPFPQWSHDWLSAGFPVAVPHPFESVHVRVCVFPHEHTDQPPQLQLGQQSHVEPVHPHEHI
jgi:hypothetical protein